MERILGCLKDGHARSVEMLAMELDTSTEDIKRQLEYLEHIGVIKRISFSAGGCGGCTGCSGCSGEGGSGTVCKGCMPAEGFQNMGEMWEVVMG